MRKQDAKIRENNFELLRAVSCIFIIVMHVAALYSDYDFRYEQMPWYYFSFPNFLQIVTRAAVPCFVMLSGAFILDDDKTKNYSSFYRKLSNKFGGHLVIFSMIAVLWRFIGGDRIQQILTDVLSGKPMGHMWYMSMLIGLYAVSPILVRLINEFGKEQFAKLSGFFLCLSCLIHYTCSLFWVLQFAEFLGYFMVGYTIRVHRDRHSRKVRNIFWIIAVISFLVAFLLSECDHYIWQLGIKYRDPNFPLVILGSVALFAAVAATPVSHISRFMQVIADRSLIIYLCHPFIYGSIDYVVRYNFGSHLNPIWYVPVLIVVCLTISTILSGIYLYCYRRWIQWFGKGIANK